MYAYGAADGDADGEVDTDGAALPDAAAEPDGDALPEGSADPVGTGTDGNGTGVGSGMKREGTPAMARMMTSTKIAMTVKIHGRASRSSRVGRAPR
jgi:hypothetical protein